MQERSHGATEFRIATPGACPIAVMVGALDSPRCAKWSRTMMLKRATAAVSPRGGARADLRWQGQPGGDVDLCRFAAKKGQKLRLERPGAVGRLAAWMAC